MAADQKALSDAGVGGFLFGCTGAQGRALQSVDPQGEARLVFARQGLGRISALPHPPTIRVRLKRTIFKL